eukprot:CAMPEP_0172357802 /NCGR_PEP_ID=MMETSP1060-20121228/2131_1 /TAXON_ID=37318 /ORGANISM="Pseudo-nitzschia pungens, Strain cf. cingulata" /LENGTH=703 /DNA_ID=CAMNT_0013078645 /DNA_START=91 /DNA_END=2202 /DNA_ORIENTATION=+
MLKQSHRFVAASLCLLLVLALGPAYGKNILSQLGSLMSDSSGSKSVLVDDAATGTVQDLEAKQAASCDGQLAVALVQANDLAAAARQERDEALTKHGDSLATIAALEKDLEHTKKNLGKETAKLNRIRDTRDQIIQEEKDRAAKELEETKAKAQQDFEALRDEKDAILKAAEEEAANILQSTKESAAKEYQSLENSAAQEFKSLKDEKDQAIASLEAKLRMSNEELEATMRSELEKAKRDKETEVAAITADRDNTVSKLTESMEAAAKEAAEILRKTQEEARATIESLEVDRDAKIAGLTQKMEAAAQTAAQVLQTTKDEAKAFLKARLAAKKEESDKATLANEERLAEKNEKIQKLQQYMEQMLEKKATVEESLKEANAENDHWRHLHSQRSYCNVTHVATDLYDAGFVAYAESVKQAEVARDLAMAHVAEGMKKSKRFVNGQVDEHWPTIQPYYEEHIANNYQVHLEPHLKKHVFPMFHKGSVWFQAIVVPMAIEVVEEIQKAYQTKVVPIMTAKHKDMVVTYGYYCKLYLREFKKASKESEILKDHPPPAYLLESWQTSCAHPRESLGALTNGILILLALIFFRRIVGLVWWMASFSLSLVLMPVRWTPLRWFLPRRSVVSETNDDANQSAESSEISDDVEPSTESPPAVTTAFSESPGSEVKVQSEGEEEDEDEDIEDEDIKMDGNSSDSNGDAAAKLY